MKKIIFTLLFISSVSLVYADQLAWITVEQAEKATKYLNKEKELIYFCACCSLDDPKQKITIEEVFYRHPETYGEIHEEYYEVVVKGTTADGRTVEWSLDLAYVHVKKKKKAYCLGLELGFECDPCTEPFDWKV